MPGILNRGSQIHGVKTKAQNKPRVKTVKDLDDPNLLVKEEDWDEEQWRKHWAEQRRGHQKRLERIHQEARHGKIR